LLRHHPWVFSGAIARVENVSQPGETVTVVSPDGYPLAQGAYSPHSQISVRIWSFDPTEQISPEFFHVRLKHAIHSRGSLFDPGHRTAFRLVNAESDGLPGIIIDRYCEFLVCQFLSAGAELWRDHIVASVRDLVPCVGIYERSDVEVRQKEGLSPHKGVLAGAEPPPVLEIQEESLRFLVDIRNGHKTGFYLDQRENRGRIPDYAESAVTLNCFAYTGAFGIWALTHQAKRVTNVDSSPEALKLAQQNLEPNGIDPARAQHLCQDVFQSLRTFRDRAEQFDLIILDPPKFVPSLSHLGAGSRAYKDINLLAFKLLRPGGILFTFSCSHLMDMSLFQKIVSDAALDAHRDAQIIDRLTQAPDHPVSLSFPEGNYLKGLICRVS
jgi:23S rRNA (cytosine1962-C5)-methyltransferase